MSVIYIGLYGEMLYKTKRMLKITILASLLEGHLFDSE